MLAMEILVLRLLSASMDSMPVLCLRSFACAYFCKNGMLVLSIMSLLVSNLRWNLMEHYFIISYQKFVVL
uniref:Uncharacterized protein n=1 Tax=Rhizophora mucronata TaxID=61149 RepID=A0A2P2KMD6_RHIMU